MMNTYLYSIMTYLKDTQIEQQYYDINGCINSKLITLLDMTESKVNQYLENDQKVSDDYDNSNSLFRI